MESLAWLISYFVSFFFHVSFGGCFGVDWVFLEIGYCQSCMLCIYPFCIAASSVDCTGEKRAMCENITMSGIWVLFGIVVVALA